MMRKVSLKSTRIPVFANVVKISIVMDILTQLCSILKKIYISKKSKQNVKNFTLGTRTVGPMDAIGFILIARIFADVVNVSLI